MTYTEVSWNSLKTTIPSKLISLIETEVSTATEIIEEDITPFRIVAEYSSRDKSHLAPPPGLHVDQYTLVRVFDVEKENVLEMLRGPSRLSSSTQTSGMLAERILVTVNCSRHKFSS